jgi:hypothetical protein
MVVAAEAAPPLESSTGGAAVMVEGALDNCTVWGWVGKARKGNGNGPLSTGRQKVGVALPRLPPRLDAWGMG